MANAWNDDRNRRCNSCDGRSAQIRAIRTTGMSGAPKVNSMRQESGFPSALVAANRRPLYSCTGSHADQREKLTCATLAVDSKEMMTFTAKIPVKHGFGLHH